jgi:hypothetical protein
MTEQNILNFIDTHEQFKKRCIEVIKLIHTLDPKQYEWSFYNTDIVETYEIYNGNIECVSEEYSCYGEDNKEYITFPLKFLWLAPNTVGDIVLKDKKDREKKNERSKKLIDNKEKADKIKKDKATLLELAEKYPDLVKLKENFKLHHVQPNFFKKD